MPELPFTGERFTPECVREIWYEHVHRYALARPIAAGKRVLDIACGEGYGSAMIAPVARTVTGIDIGTDAIAHARSRYRLLPNLNFREGDATRFDAGGERYDLVLSFETLEHVEAQDGLVGGIAAALADDGCALISSPDKAVYSDVTGYQNAFHVRELYRDELLALLSRHFRCVRLYGQRLMFHSTIWSLDGPRANAAMQTARADGRYDNEPCAPPMYFIAACAQREADLPNLPGIALFADDTESVYDDYRQETRRNARARVVLAEQEAALTTMRDALAQAQARIHDLESAVASSVRKPSRFWPFGR
ncbi:MAG: methyltransferase domain-containing protein [Rhodanobacteraceae bacterium]|nr:methyltransferase domain-containing protein [Rhodanobacteraceae bacterium]MBK7044586.1 methyltransferase domain-containing protein [Rhodanobacteraceae bacterium]MBP9153993.1 methyltransferase domain-containing protein [Xanthomonadales bacterium]HQW82670.1 methyltransferase domain-containing protein [Pseudomonadota bacterium]